jgi:signal transduction histidine kinase
LHDNVGTQLSLISNNIEWVEHPLKAITESEKANKLHFVNQTARDIITTLRETIWALNKEQISIEEFSDKLKAFVQKQLAIYPEIELQFTEHITEKTCSEYARKLSPIH